MHLPAILTTISLASTAMAGINCKGSMRCSWLASAETTWHDNIHHTQSLLDLILTIPSDTVIPDAVQIACTRDICASLQGTNGWTAPFVVAMAENIVDHGCHRCGHCPVGYPRNNNSKKSGMLVMDWSPKPCVMHGLCPQFAELAINATAPKDDAPQDEVEDLLTRTKDGATEAAGREEYSTKDKMKIVGEEMGVIAGIEVVEGIAGIL